MNKQDWLKHALAKMYAGQWYGFKKDYTGETRMSYENIIVYDNSITKPTEEEVEAKIQELKNKYELKQYQRDRAKDYPSIQEQLDMQYWDKINGTNKWQQAINAVKQKYPK